MAGHEQGAAVRLRGNAQGGVLPPGLQGCSQRRPCHLFQHVAHLPGQLHGVVRVVEVTGVVDAAQAHHLRKVHVDQVSVGHVETGKSRVVRLDSVVVHSVCPHALPVYRLGQVVRPGQTIVTQAAVGPCN